MEDETDETLKDYEDTWFQILTIETESGKLKKKLVYGTKKNLIKYYKIAKDNLPTIGVEVNKNFVTSKDPEFFAVRFLLQCRKLSQLISYTWLDEEKIPNSLKTEIGLVREIFKLSIIPKLDNSKSSTLVLLPVYPKSF
ncbi:MAG: hypothetical protein KME54_00005 [Tolypothrix brevis GSE-NOS-MK-07-07A]|nr:hypothetical protein [Tolypothrix brevis GSE-NOS-MK-07-07A]